MPVSGKADPNYTPEMARVGIPSPGQEALQEGDLLPQILSALLGGAVMGQWPVKTIGQSTGRLGQWLETMAASQERNVGAPRQSVQHLVTVLEDHGVPARLDGSGNLWAIDTGSNAKTGATSSQWVRLEPTLKAVKSWLGY